METDRDTSLQSWEFLTLFLPRSESCFRDTRPTTDFLKVVDEDRAADRARPRMIVYECACAAGRESWTAHLRLKELCDATDAAVPPLPEPLLACERPLFDLGADDADARDVRAALQALESHVSHVARLVRDAMLAAVADPDLEERVALAFRRRAAGDVRGR